MVAILMMSTSNFDDVNKISFSSPSYNKGISKCKFTLLCFRKNITPLYVTFASVIYNSFKMAVFLIGFFMGKSEILYLPLWAKY